MDVAKPEENLRQLTGITRGMERQLYMESETEILFRVQFNKCCLV